MRGYPETLFANLAPEIKQEIQELITQLKSLESNSPDLVLTPDDYFNQGNALFFTGDYEGAIKSYNQAIEIQPFHEAWYNKGLVQLFNLKQYENAITSFDEALKINQGLQIAWYNKAQCYALIDNVNLAIDNLQKAIELNPEYKNNAKTDPDFDEIREDERFKQLIED
ncbi:tetratricopeptide repeat protein [Anabaena sp. UHCC 0253]|uniref:tetratricopeptide repeat protein n=1 Tax=Anabaena sp. UHCC 0253 TaxID=2590019 RepID=UPI001C2B9331|nr:tetratricopeptide repeat protein [Anabaena sp. UHCC 0253]